MVSLRFGNTFGPAQPLAGHDVGLIADMIGKSLAGERIEVFEVGRMRTLHYAADLARMIEGMAGREPAGFAAINVPGEYVAISELASQVAFCTGGTLSHKPLPADISAIDAGNALLDCTLFAKYFGEPQLTSLAAAIAVTVADACDRLGIARRR